MIRVRRVESSLPFARKYELELERRGEAANRAIVRRGAAVRRLETIVGVGDAWSFLDEADRQWKAGNRGWAVELEEAG